jgi:hypothetical protein
MPVTVNVSVSFEAEDRAAGEELMADWRLHEGCRVLVAVMENLPPQQASVEGSLEPVPEPTPPEPPPPLEVAVGPEEEGDGAGPA